LTVGRDDITSGPVGEFAHDGDRSFSLERRAFARTRLTGVAELELPRRAVRVKTPDFVADHLSQRL
jgi:hypothetical protein